MSRQPDPIFLAEVRAELEDLDAGDQVELVFPDEDESGVFDAVVAWLLEQLDPADVPVDDDEQSGGG